MTTASHCSKNDESVIGEQKRLVRLWEQFNAEFPTDKDCLEEIYRRASEMDMIKCPHCGARDLEKNYGERTSRCPTCKRESWLTAGTFFNHMRLPRAWLAAIWLMEHGVSINSHQFHKLAGVAYSSALNIFKKLTVVIHSQMSEDALAISSLQFLPVICKRSKETPARQHPRLEQEEIDKQLLKDSQKTEESCNSEKLSGTQKEVYELLSTEPVHADILCQQARIGVAELAATLVMLELDGLAVRVPGDRYIRGAAKETGFRESTIGTSGSRASRGIVAETVANVIDFVRLRFHGISRKSLQNYLAAYWCHVDRVKWRSGSLLKACLRSPSITNREVLAYVSPAMVKLLLVP